MSSAISSLTPTTLRALYKQECAHGNLPWPDLSLFTFPQKELTPTELLEKYKLLKLHVEPRKQLTLESADEIDMLETMVQLLETYEGLVSPFKSSRNKAERVAARIEIAKKFCQERFFDRMAITIIPTLNLIATGSTLLKIEANQRPIAEGTFKRVYLAENLLDQNASYVLLAHNPHKFHTVEMHNSDLIREKSFSERLLENAAQIEWIFRFNRVPSLFAIAPYFRGGSLLDYIDGKRVKPKKITRKKWAHDLIQAGVAMQRAGIIHRDIWPGNLLLDGDRLLLTDFGTAVNHGDRVSKVVRGVHGYQPPELPRTADQPSHKQDIWPVGIVLCQLLFMKYPCTMQALFAQFRWVKNAYAGGRLTIEQVSDQKRWEGYFSQLLRNVFDSIPEDSPYLPLIKAALTIDPAKRPDAEEIAQLWTAISSST
ncbi:MAG: protein kinase [Verrucomicrobia bacterium]|nr:protein kinase [Verrucomicrobiota bacterium]